MPLNSSEQLRPLTSLRFFVREVFDWAIKTMEPPGGRASRRHIIGGSGNNDPECRLLSPLRDAIARLDSSEVIDPEGHRANFNSSRIHESRKRCSPCCVKEK